MEKIKEKLEEKYNWSNIRPIYREYTDEKNYDPKISKLNYIKYCSIEEN